MVKSEKLYFVDTGIACSLLNIKNPQELAQHYNWGGLVESADKAFVVYGGSENQSWPVAKVLGWQNAGQLINSILPNLSKK